MTTIYLDFDNTIVESNQRIIEMLNEKYGVSKTEDDLKDYDFNSICPITNEEKFQMFESDRFYEELRFKPGILDVLNKYSNFYNIVVISSGTKNNLYKKEKWLRNNLHLDFNFIGCDINIKNSKNKVDMSDAIQIDDTFECLGTNAAVKILYKNFNNFPWQVPNGSIDEFMVVNTWDEIGSILDFYKNYNCKTLEKIK